MLAGYQLSPGSTVLVESPMRVLVADDDAVFRRLLGGVLRERTGHDVQLVENGAQALEAALGPDRPDVLVLDWLMPLMTGTQVCKVVRTTRLERQPHVLFVTARARREEIIECLSAGGDDILTKPVAPDVFIARIELARQRLYAPRGTGSQLRTALLNARGEGDGDGELVVRSGQICAKVLFSRGKVAWVRLDDGSNSLFAELETTSGIDAATARQVVEECRITRASVTETLIAWGLVERAHLRELMRQWVASKLSALCSLPNPEFIFLPTKYTGSVELSFDLSEVLPDVNQEPIEALQAERSPTLIPKGGWSSAFTSEKAPQSDAQTLVGHCMAGDGVLGAAVLDRVSGACLARAGRELDPDLTWAQIQILNTVCRTETPEDCVIATEQHLHLAAPCSPGSNEIVCVIVSSRDARLATARLDLKRAIALKEASTR